jgi:hypothetical protein
MRSFFLLWLKHFPRKIWEDDQNPNTLRNFSSYKIRFKKSSSKRSKNTGGGIKAVLKNSKQRQIFSSYGFPYGSNAPIVSTVR